MNIAFLVNQENELALICGGDRRILQIEYDPNQVGKFWIIFVDDPDYFGGLKTHIGLTAEQIRAAGVATVFHSQNPPTLPVDWAANPIRYQYDVPLVDWTGSGGKRAPPRLFNQIWDWLHPVDIGMAGYQDI